MATGQPAPEGWRTLGDQPGDDRTAVETLLESIETNAREALTLLARIEA